MSLDFGIRELPEFFSPLAGTPISCFPLVARSSHDPPDHAGTCPVDQPEE